MPVISLGYMKKTDKSQNNDLRSASSLSGSVSLKPAALTPSCIHDAQGWTNVTGGMDAKSDLFKREGVRIMWRTDRLRLCRLEFLDELKKQAPEVSDTESMNV